MAKKTKQAQIEDILMEPIIDRRLLPHVPDAEKVRVVLDRRTETDKKNLIGQRYKTRFPVKLTFYVNGKRSTMQAECGNISCSGILLSFVEATVSPDTLAALFQNAKKINLSFKIPPGAMPEGYEMRVRTSAKFVRVVQGDSVTLAFSFGLNLNEYARQRKDRYALAASSISLFFIVAFIMFMRAGSVIYFQFNKMLYTYSITAAVFLLSRYLFGALYRPVPVDPEFTPGVTVIIPCFNEEKWIKRTIVSCVNQDYPIDKLEVIVVDDCSTDTSPQMIKEMVERLHDEDARFKTKERISYILSTQNKGKREELAVGAKAAKHELLVFVDSDSFLDPYAIRNLVQPFKDPKVGGVSGRCDVANTFTNGLSKMQAVRYYISFRIMKAAESYFDTVTCLSGPIACYKKQIVLDNCDSWLNQQFLGRRATFGDDRAMTNFVLRNHRTCYQDTAICETIVPNNYPVFLKQQMRWKRSWLRESLICGSFVWKKEPFASLFFYMGLAVPILGPFIVLYNLIYVPITSGIFPTAFLIGLFLMSALMSSVQLLTKRSSTWLYGFYFCLFYECVLLWQMPIAMVTFWKSVWGTRMTPEDIEQEAQKAQKRKGKGQDTPAPG